jgi:VRR-NUC domain-containing protein
LRFVVFKHRNVGIWKRASEHYIPLPFGEKGIADIIACSPEGRFWAIEVKKPGGGKPSSDQISFLNRVRAKNGIVIVAHSIDDVMERFQ